MDLKTLFDQIAVLFQNFTLKQRIVALVSILIVVGFIVFLLLFRAKDSMIGSGYSILFEKTNAGDSALIIQQLEKDGVPYKVVNEGTIAVPSNMVYKQRISIAALGIPKDSKVGFEIFDQNEFGATDFEQKIKYLRALEGELARTIEGLMPIEKASVHIAIPKETVFAEKKSPTTASIVLSIRRGMKLSIKQITGIKNLVSASIANLMTEDVSLVDQEGVPLGDEDSAAYEGELVKSQIKYKKEFERDIEDKIINVLAPVIGGVDKVVAKVTIDFDFAREDSVSEVYDPNSVPRSEQSVEEKREGSQPKDVGGVPGAVSNIGPVQGLESNNATEKYEKSSATTNYEISKKVTNVKGEFATIKRLSTAVVVDGNYDFTKDADGVSTGKLEYIPLSEAQMASINDIVKQTVGFNVNRGDEVTVSNFEFKPLQKDGTKAPTQNMIDKITYYSSPLIPIIKYLIAGILLFIFYKKVIEPFSEKMIEHSSEEYTADEMKLESEEDEDSAEDTLEKFKKARKKVEDQLGIGEEFNEEELKYDVLLEKLKALADDKSEEIAGLLETMIRNEGDYESPGRGSDGGV
ncbi:flagellar basal-body MS-ring/collar protein FliF [Sulfurospirillum arcachonense]|uniref:flagellar basal-body MS-ring/collar protein FliF n=1 Tax=Sulfurospirillum arcachonense TaxID=57666 RepID=UPI00046AC800|nr:flagellar basal-body MS-ring/collar protein FliF [Sulfurospirillum arcachonense]